MKQSFRGSAQTSVFDPGCVKTCTSQECAELFSLSSSPSSGRKYFWFSNWRNRDGISTRKLHVGVFTRPRPVSDIGPRGSLRRRLRGPCDPTVDLTAKRHKIDRLGEKRLCAAFQGFPPGIVVALGGDHDDWNVRSCSFRPGIRVRARTVGRSLRVLEVSQAARRRTACHTKRQ